MNTPAHLADRIRLEESDEVVPTVRRQRMDGESGHGQCDEDVGAWLGCADKVTGVAPSGHT